MRRSPLLLVLALALSLAGAAPAAHAAARSSCVKPKGLKVVKRGSLKVVLRWRTPKRGTFRVTRSGRVIGQTKRHTMTVMVKPGRKVKLGVGLVRAGGRSPRCYARISTKTKASAHAPAGNGPAAPDHLRIDKVEAGVATVAWNDVATAARYRIYRDGATVGETPNHHFNVKVTAGRSAEVEVASVSRGGAVGKHSAALSVRTDRKPPGAPTGLHADSVTAFGLVLSWTRGASGSGPVRGYRVSRNGIVVGQVPQTSLRLTGLLPSTHYVLTVQAVDSQGLPWAPATLTLDTPAPDPSTGTIGAFVLASTGSSFADFRDHYQRIGTLYPTYFDCDHSNPAHIAGKDDPQVTAFAHARGIPVIPRYNCQGTTYLRAIMNDPGTEQAVISRLVSPVTTNRYDGINLDLEAGAPTDRASLTAFVGALADAL